MLREFWNNPLSIATARATARWMVALARHLLVLLPAGTGILFRRNVGVRHLPRMFLGLLLFFSIVVFDSTGIGFLLFILMLILALKHAWVALFRTSDNGPRHSCYEGDSQPFWRDLGFSQDAAQRFLEPLASLGLASLLFPIVPVLGVWFAGAGIAQAVKEFLNRARINRRALDAIDSRIESQQMSATIDRHLRPETESAERFHTARLAGRRDHPRNPRP